MKNKICIRLLAAFLVLLTLCFTFASCGKKAINESMRDEGYADYNEEMKVPGDAEDGFGSNISASTSTAIPTDRKIIKTFDISCETKAYDTALSSLNELIAECGGYVESASSTNKSLNNSSTYYSRYATYTLRIPAENAESFVGSVGSLFNVTSNRSYVDDVSESYYSIEARLEELQVERDSLLDILDQSETKADYSLWTTVHTRLSEVTQQIAVYQGQLNRYDSQVAYSTVNLSVSEVLNYSEISKDNSYGSRLGAAFKEGWNGFVEGIQDFTIWFAEALPTLLLLAVFVTLVIFVIRTVLKKKRK